MVVFKSFNTKDNRVTREELRDSLERYSRAGFSDILAQLMQCRPTEQDMLNWASAHPDKWAAALSIIARLAGFTDETIVHNLTYDVSKMGDAQLLQSITDLRLKLGHTHSDTKVIEHAKAPIEPVHNVDSPLAELSESELDEKLLVALQKGKRKTPRNR